MRHPRTVKQHSTRTSFGDEVIIQTQQSCSIDSVQSHPPPTTVIFGWFAARNEQVARYAAIFERMGYNTVHLVAPVSAVYGLNPSSLIRYVISVVRILADDNQLTEGGIVFFYMSNAGALCSMHLVRMLAGDHRYREFLNEDDIAALAKLKRTMAAVIYESAPCYFYEGLAADAFILGMNAPRGLPSWTVRRLFAICIWIQQMFSWDLKALFWTTMLEADYPCAEQYIYSGSDNLLDAARLDALIEHRKGNGKHVTVLRVEDAGHMLVFKKVPKLYLYTLRNVNEWGVNAHRREAGLNEWKVER